MRILQILSLTCFLGFSLNLIAEDTPTLEQIISESPGNTADKKTKYRDKLKKLIQKKIDDKKTEEIVTALSKKWPTLSRAQTKEFFQVLEELRGSNKDFDEAVKKGFTENLLAKEADINPCEYMCSIFDNAGDWAKKGVIDFDKVPMDHQSSAYQTLGLYFMIKANKFCGKDKTYFFGLCDKSQVDCKEVSETWANNLGKKKCPELDIDNVGALNEDEVTKLVTDISKIMKAPGNSGNQFEMYTNVYNLKIIKELISEMEKFPESDKNKGIIANLKKQQEGVNKRIDRDLSSYQALTGGSFGSLLNNYALGVAVEASDSKKSPAIDYMERVAEQIKDTPTAVPYSARSGFKSGNPRSGGARSVPFYLALLEKQEPGSDAEKKHRGNLFKALKNYTTLLPDLIAVLGSGSAHVGKDHLAPYYFYSTLPYATAAIKKLRSKGELTKEEKEILDNLETTTKKAIKAVKSSKDATAKNDEWWGGGSQGYVNPLLGLTLMPMCEGTKGKSILD